MRTLLLLASLTLLTACSTPTTDVAQTQARANENLVQALAYFGSTEKELDLFIEGADPTLADRILTNSQQSSSGGESDRVLVRSIQHIAAAMEHRRVSPERFAQLCERLRFTVIATAEYTYPFVRVHENLCWRGSQATAPPHFGGDHAQGFALTFSQGC